MNFKAGQIVRDEWDGKTIRVETVLDIDGYIALEGEQLKKDLTPDLRKWSQKTILSTTPNRKWKLEVIG